MSRFPSKFAFLSAPQTNAYLSSSPSTSPSRSSSLVLFSCRRRPLALCAPTICYLQVRAASFACPGRIIFVPSGQREPSCGNFNQRAPLFGFTLCSRMSMWWSSAGHTKYPPGRGEVTFLHLLLGNLKWMRIFRSVFLFQSYSPSGYLDFYLVSRSDSKAVHRNIRILFKKTKQKEIQNNENLSIYLVYFTL